MKIVCSGFGTVSSRGEKRFVRLPAPLPGGRSKLTVTACRLPFLALYMKPENAAAFIKKFVPPPGRSSWEASALLKMMQSSLLDTALLPGKPLEIPFYLKPDGLGRLACLKAAHGPALLALCRPEDMVQALGVLSMHFGKITYQDEKELFSAAIEIRSTHY